MRSPLTSTLSIAMTLAVVSQGCVNTAASSDKDAGNLRPTPTMNKETKRWTSSDGAEFPFRYWLPPENPPKAILVGVHGLNGSSKDFTLFGNSLIKDDIGVYAYEMRGQGNDPVKERVGDIKHPSAWISDLATFCALIHKAHPDAKIFIFGESVGSLITTFTVQNERVMTTPIAGVILASPVVSISGKLPLIKRLALHLAAIVAPTYRIEFTGLSPKDPGEMMVTNSTSVTESSEMTPWLVEKFSLRFFSSLDRMVGQMMHRAGDFKTPVLVVAGEKDVVTEPGEFEKFTKLVPEEYRSGILYPEGHHLLLYDDINDEVVEDCREWLLDQLTR